jgi:Uma2 family endonuclease
MPYYSRCGVAHAWLVDPELRTLEAYRLERALWVWLGTWRDDASVRVEPFDAVALPLGALWKGRAPRTP